MHTKNILADPRVSLMLDERKPGDPLEGARVMLMGTAAATDDADARRRYLARHPEAEMFAGFRDFAFYQVTLKGAHLVAGFGRIVDLDAGRYADRLERRRGAARGRAGRRRAHERRSRRGLRLYATKLLGAPDGAWRCVGCDPEGLDLQLDRLALRLAFPAAGHFARRAAAGAQGTGRRRRGAADLSRMHGLIRSCTDAAVGSRRAEIRGRERPITECPCGSGNRLLAKPLAALRCA